MRHATRICALVLTAILAGCVDGGAGSDDETAPIVLDDALSAWSRGGELVLGGNGSKKASAPGGLLVVGLAAVAVALTRRQ